MKTDLHRWQRSGVLLAINLMFLTIWGFAGIEKILSGAPPWFGDRFGQTLLAKFPGLTATFWLLTLAELLALTLAAASLFRGEFLGKRSPVFLQLMLVWSLLVFVQLGFGQWLTGEYNGTIQIFTYFGVTLIAYQFVAAPASRSNEPDAGGS
jgi:hypothetical protein